MYFRSYTAHVGFECWQLAKLQRACVNRLGELGPKGLPCLHSARNPEVILAKASLWLSTHKKMMYWGLQLLPARQKCILIYDSHLCNLKQELWPMWRCAPATSSTACSSLPRKGWQRGEKHLSRRFGHHHQHLFPVETH